MAIGPPLALIAGPTASGKSELALALAERARGVIINADSAQLYRDLPVLSAAPTASERGRAEHRLYGVLDGAEPSTAAAWANLAKLAIEDVHASGRLPILVGGTGLYIRTLLEGIAPVPPIAEQVRAEVRATTVGANYARLQSLDPDSAARLKSGDSARIARALEVALSTGRPLGEWQRRREGGIGDRVQLKPLLLLPPREWLYRRCDERFERMMKVGAVAEVAALIRRNLPPTLPVMRAIGVREIAALLRGDIDQEQALALGSQATRRYAKRQFTWFAHQPPESWPRHRPPIDDGIVEALALIGAKA